MLGVRSAARGGAGARCRGGGAPANPPRERRAPQLRAQSACGRLTSRAPCPCSAPASGGGRAARGRDKRQQRAQRAKTHEAAAARRRNRGARSSAACGSDTHLVQDSEPRKRCGNRLADAAGDATGEHHAQSFVICGAGGGVRVSARRAGARSDVAAARARHTRRRSGATRAARAATRRRHVRGHTPSESASSAGRCGGCGPAATAAWPAA